MLALAEYRKLLCPCGCGYLVEVSHAARNEFRFTVETPRCHARTAIAKKQTRDTADFPDGLLYVAHLPDEGA